MTEPQPAAPHRVLVAGGGVAGLEAVCALHALAPGHVDVTLLEPLDTFTVKARSVEDPFAIGRRRTYPLAAVCEDHGARHVRAKVARVAAAERRAVLPDGTALPYDSLLVAVGARPRTAYPQAHTFRGPQDAEALHGLVQDLEGRYVRRFAFVVPPGTTWPLPLYELALLTAQRAYDMGLDYVEITLVTPEEAPLAVFGPEASGEVAIALADAGVVVRPRLAVSRVDHGVVHAVPGDVRIEVDRVVALPVLAGPHVSGLPADQEGFLAVDEEGRVRGVEDVFAAGDGTTNPIKQGGIGAQQADAAAVAIARRAGADLDPAPFRPVLRGKLLTGGRARFLRRTAPDAGSTATEHALWWPPSKVAAPHLAPYLERLDRGERGPARPPVARVVHAQGDPTGGVEVLGG
jgi:sulfide:quinone oxidoreductase